MRVRFTRPAQRDLAQIHAYISQDSPDIASRFVARLIERSRKLADNPFEGRETDEPNARVIIARRSSAISTGSSFAPTDAETGVPHSRRSCSMLAANP